MAALVGRRPRWGTGDGESRPFVSARHISLGNSLTHQEVIVDVLLSLICLAVLLLSALLAPFFLVSSSWPASVCGIRI